MIFAVDGRYLDVGALGETICGILPLKFDRRSSDYLGGDYLLARTSDGCTVRVRKNYSSFLDEWFIEDRRDAEYAIIVERCQREDDFAALVTLPGVERCDASP